MMNIPLSKPWITEDDIKEVAEVLKTPNLSLGPKLLEFENMLLRVSGRKFAVAVNSGTSALHLIIRSLGIKDGDEVITTPFSFIASSNCILFERAKPVFVDIDPNTYNINPELIEEKITDKTKAILAVDVFGQPASWDRLIEIAKKYNLYLIEDSAEAIGSEYKGKPAGSFGVASVFAFYPNKQITTGEGGVVLTDNEQVYKLSKSMRNQGRGEEETWLYHTRLGYNYRISDINCALGISQLNRLNKIIEMRDTVAKMYSRKLSEVEEVITPYISPDTTRMSWFVYVIRLKDKFYGKDRNIIIESLGRRGIQTRNYFEAIHLEPFYVEQFGFKEGDFPVTEFVADRTIALPFYTTMTEGEVDYVIKNLKEVIYEVKHS
ncbi:DegT/DnrJ/EryC1/StrS family aminotransferase [Caldisericum sp. AR60]|uniref:DegT/DnrJ/EryC1/StrS family aminotransferase n=1 Tax=Caldisericum sp. AR60 TaxID=3397852 RepID=UPI0039FD814A